MAMAASDASRSSAAADSYVGSLISLTSKSEIRYEGVLHTINTDESSIGLTNVRSFGTEGRKKDGPQIPPTDRIYEYILFRGSDIKDLQVKSSPPAQPTASIHNDPAIIQSHYSRPTSTSTSMPSVGSVTVSDPGSHVAQIGMPRTTFPDNMPLYQPGGSLGSWGSPQPNANGSGLGMPIYWQGFYPPSGGLPHLQQLPLLRPPPGLSVPHSLQPPLQYPGLNISMPSAPSNISGMNATFPPGSVNSLGPSASLPELPSSLFPPVSGNLSLSSSTLPLTLTATQATALASEMPPTNLQNNHLVPSFPVASTATLATSLPSAPQPESLSTPVSVQPRTTAAPNLALQAVSQPSTSTVDLSSSKQAEASQPSLVTPGQLLHSGPSAISSSQPQTMSSKEVEVNVARKEPAKLGSTEANAPILPLPTPLDPKPNGAASHYYHHNNWGRGRGRGRSNGYSRPITKFTEDFDFTAMNEKFNKDEVWGHLGKSQSRQGEGDYNEDYEYHDDVQEQDAGTSSIEVKPVYVKDDFFDSLSCNALDRGARNGRTRFSEQLKLDTETFGDFPRHRPNRGGRGFRGGRGRGSYGGRGHGYFGRGRGRGYSTPSWAS